MDNFTTNNYEMKRDIINFQKFSLNFSNHWYWSIIAIILDISWFLPEYCIICNKRNTCSTLLRVTKKLCIRIFYALENIISSLYFASFIASATFSIYPIFVIFISLKL